MEDKIQLLTNKIYEEGVVKANEEAATILATAKEKAAAMMAEAEKKAQQILGQAQRESDALRENVNSEIRLSARQAISALRQEMANIITFKTTQVPLGEAIQDKDFLKSIIETVITNWGENGQVSPNLHLLLPEKAKENVDGYLSTSVKKQLDNGLELKFSKSIATGFRIGPADGSYVVSFSEKDFEHLFREYLRPKTVQMLFGDK